MFLLFDAAFHKLCRTNRCDGKSITVWYAEWCHASVHESKNECNFLLYCAGFIHIFLFYARQDEMLTLMSHKVFTLLAAGKVRLLIIDSVAGLFRGSDDASKSVPAAADYFMRRSKKLSAFGSLLHSLSARYGTVVVVINQVCNRLVMF